jgi:membrane protease YdiL (CAAX protease family)
MRAIMQKYPATSYFVLAIAISWTAVLSVIWPGPIPAEPADATRQFPFVYLAMLAGPPIAGILLTALIQGTEGLRDFRRRLLRWKVAPHWYGIALLTAPLVVLAANFALSSFSTHMVPSVLGDTNDPAGPIQSTNRLSFILMCIAVGVGAGLFEELGWTGFATPTLRKRYAPLRTALMIGVVWSAWHFLAVFWGSAGSFGSVPIPLFLGVALFSFLPPYRILMTMVYERTHSLFIGVLMHASLTTSMLLLAPGLAGYESVMYNVAFSALLWAVAAAGLLSSGAWTMSPTRSPDF